ncbi:MAG: type I methionyl aminopeptidase [Actinomycetota bacterium]
MSVQKSFAELEKMHRACSIVVETLAVLAEAIKPGIRTRELDRIARERIEKEGSRPAFLGYKVRGLVYPATLCVAINDEVVHGIPGEKRLEEGDIIGLDLGCIVDGFYGDSARTVAVGRVSPEAQKLMQVTEESLRRAIAQCKPGSRLGDVGHAVQSHAEAHGFSVVREFTGHGIGTRLHEEPQVPNYGKPGRGGRLNPGLCLAIEPMVNAGGPEVEMKDDGWTAVTADGSLSAHFELSVAVMPEGPWVLSEPYPYGARRAAS